MESAGVCLYPHILYPLCGEIQCTHGKNSMFEQICGRYLWILVLLKQLPENFIRVSYAFQSHLYSLLSWF